MDRSTASPAPPRSIHPPAVQRVFDDRPFRSDGELLALTYTADGTLWTVEDPGVLRQWDLRGQRQLAWLVLNDLENLWAFSRDGRVLASASDELSLWEVASGQLQAVLPQPAWVTALALRGEAGLVASGHDDGSVCVWDAANDEQVHAWRGHGRPISALAFSPDGKRLASAGEDRLIHLWDVTTGSQCGTLMGHNGRIPALAWHPRGHRLYSAGWDTAVWVWDLASLAPLILLNNHANELLALALNADGTRLATADSSAAIHVWDLDSYRDLRVIQGFDGEVRGLAFRGDGQELAAGGSDRIVHLWNLEEAVVAPEPGADSAAGPQARGLEPRTTMALGTDGTHFAALRPGHGVRVWDVSKEQKVLDLDEAGRLNAVAWSPDGRWIAAGGTDSAIRLWEAQTGRRHGLLEGLALPVTALAFSASGARLASASAIGCDVWLWDPENGTPALLIPDAVDGCAIEALAFQPGREGLAVAGIDWLATGGSDGAIHLWDLAPPRRRLTLRGGARSLAFHPDGHLLAATSLVRTVRLWDARTGRLLREAAGHTDAVNCVAYSPDGRYLASAADDHTIRLWDGSTGRPLGVTQLDTQVKVLRFAPDGRSLFTGNGNTSCYQLRTQRLLNGDR